jgi:hypothetical protein
MWIKVQLLQNHDYMVRKQYFTFFPEKNWGRSEKMDKNKMSIFVIWNRKSIFNVKKSEFIA